MLDRLIQRSELYLLIHRVGRNFAEPGLRQNPLDAGRVGKGKRPGRERIGRRLDAPTGAASSNVVVPQPQPMSMTFSPSLGASWSIPFSPGGPTCASMRFCIAAHVSPALVFQ